MRKTPQQSQTDEDLAAAENAVEQPQEQPAEAPDDSEEIEFEGLKLALPKDHANKLKSALEAQKDYTKKSQENAEARRQLQAKEQMLQAQEAFSKATFSDVVQLQQIDAQMQQLRNLDWSQLDTEQMLRARHQIDQLRDAREQAAKALEAKRNEFHQKVSQHMAEIRKAGERQLQQWIPDFSPKTVEALREYAQESGYQPEEVEAILDPRHVRMMWKAQQWDKLQASKPEVTNRANQAARVVKPGPVQPKKTTGEVLSKVIKTSKDPRVKHAAIQKYLEGKV